MMTLEAIVMVLAASAGTFESSSDTTMEVPVPEASLEAIAVLPEKEGGEEGGETEGHEGGGTEGDDEGGGTGDDEGGGTEGDDEGGGTGDEGGGTEGEDEGGEGDDM